MQFFSRRSSTRTGSIGLMLRQNSSKLRGYRGTKTGTVTTLRPSVEVSMPSSDLFQPADVSFVLEGFDLDGRKVAEVASSPLADPATGEVRMLRGQSIKVPIRILEGFNGQIELHAAHPSTGEIFATLKLATDFHH
jgi:hypothetical protein